MATNKKDLKAFVRYDGTGRVISGSLILQRNKPKVGNWHQIQAYECCDPSCPNSVYLRDWVIYGVEEVVGGWIFYMAISPFEYNIKLEFQFLNCMTGEGFGPIITIDESTGYEYNWFVTDHFYDEACAIQSRRICGVNYQSAWTFGIGG